MREGVGADPKIDPSGELYDGRRFADAEGLKRLLLDDTDKFAQAFTAKLATYALRRAMTLADQAELRRMVEQAKARDYPLAFMVESLIVSDLFRNR